MISSAPHSMRWITAASLLAFAATGYSQTTPRPDRGERDHGPRLSQVMKYKILIQDDQAAGQVVDFILSDAGCIDYVVATYEDQYYVIPYSAATVRPADSIVFVDLAPARFQQVQFFAADNWPDFYVPTYRNRIFNTFGVDVIRRDGRTTFRRDLDDDDAADRRERRDRREDARERRQENREERHDRREERRENRRDPDNDATRNADKPADRDRPQSKPAPKTKTPPKPDLGPKSNPMPDPPKADPKKPPVPKAPTPKLPMPKAPAEPKEPAPK